MNTSPPPSPASTSTSMDSSTDLLCVGRLEVVRPKPVGFLCGSIPVPTDNSFNSFNSALVPSAQTLSAPRYRMLPNETDLNMPPAVLDSSVKALALGSVQSKAGLEIALEGGPISSNLARKCDALAVSGLTEYGDEIDVIAPADIVKQIFKMPYSKARLSIAVRRVGRTLVLNTGPDVKEGEKLVRRHSSPSACADQSLFLNFAMHSVRMEACDCPPTYQAPLEEQYHSSVLHGGDMSQYSREMDGVSQTETEGLDNPGHSQAKQDGFFWGTKKNKINQGRSPIKKASHLSEKPRFSVQESQKYKRVSNDGFLRVLFWQFHNFRMLLGSDLLLFTNEKYAAVSLHLWDVKHQVTPLTWLEAWLDNVMANVPEVAICYHQDGVVQGYELLKTDDIFLVKGISDDGTLAFHPYVVQQNGLSVFRFLQKNCNQDPGAYWLYKSAGDDAIQLFDMSVMPKDHSPGSCDDNSNPLPSLLHKGKMDFLFSLGTLLYRIAHRLSLSTASTDREKCARFFRKCLEFMDEPDHLVLRALAHEQYARLILNYDDELDLSSDCFPGECKITVTDADGETLDCPSNASFSSLLADEKPSENGSSLPESVSEALVSMTLEKNISSPSNLIKSSMCQSEDTGRSLSLTRDDKNLASLEVSSHFVQNIAGPISSKMSAVHHVSQAIKNLRWMRQVQSTESNNSHDESPSSINFSVCACGDSECIEVCDMWDWLPTSRVNHKMWKLVLLLGESYLALGEAYKEDKQLKQALKVVQLACSVYGSMPRKLENTHFISSLDVMNKKARLVSGRAKKDNANSRADYLSLNQNSFTDLFWAKAWTLIGDVYTEFHILSTTEISTEPERKPSLKELQVPSDVVNEVKRLKKKLRQYGQNCSLCSLVNCSCMSDRADSNSSASSSGGVKQSKIFGRKYIKRSATKTSAFSLLEHLEYEYAPNHRKDTASKINASRMTIDKPDMNLLEMSHAHSEVTFQTENSSCGTTSLNDGGVFKYLTGPVIGGDAEENLLAAVSCYEKAIRATGVVRSGMEQLQSLNKKKGWACNELGRIRLEKKDLIKAEQAFSDAIKSFREVSDLTNIILIICNLGHGRRALAEEMVAKVGHLKKHTIFHDAYKGALENAKLEYSESLRFYAAAKLELNDFVGDGEHAYLGLRNEVYTQFAHTYLRLGMLLASEDSNAEVYEIGAFDDISLRKREISANDSIREALSVYESLGELRKQETAFAYFQLACHQRDCCLKFLESDLCKSSLPKGENSNTQRVKQYASLAERNWQKAMEFYGSKTHPTMYLTILMERSALSSILSNSLHSNAMMESALSHMLEGRHATCLKDVDSEVHAKFWCRLQTILKQMLGVAISSKKSPVAVSVTNSGSNRLGDCGKLKELYKMSLKAKDLRSLNAMHSLWAS